MDVIQFVLGLAGGALVTMVVLAMLIDAIGEEAAFLVVGVALLTIAMCLPGFARAADAKPLNVLECAALAGEYSADPFALQVGQLDALRLCVADHMALIQRERDDAREGRAIQRNFGKLEDAE